MFFFLNYRHNYGQFNWESRTTFLRLNYRFGRGKNKAKSRRNRDNRGKQGDGGFF